MCIMWKIGLYMFPSVEVLQMHHPSYIPLLSNLSPFKRLVNADKTERKLSICIEKELVEFFLNQILLLLYSFYLLPSFIVGSSAFEDEISVILSKTRMLISFILEFGHSWENYFILSHHQLRKVHTTWQKFEKRHRWKFIKGYRIVIKRHFATLGR